MSVQINLFQRLKSQLPAQFSLVNIVAELLNVSNDSAYRRIRGETALSMEEIIILLKHFKMSLEELDQDTGTVAFSYNAVDSEDVSMEKYLSAILEDLKKISMAPEKEIVFAAKDVPIFHHFRFPELASFKIFFWMKSILNAPSLEHINFDAAKIGGVEVELGKEILKLYVNIPVIEVWTEETLNSTIKQVEYFWESGFFNKREDALLLCDQLKDMMGHVKKQAEMGYKYLHDSEAKQDQGNYRMYFSEVMIGNNNILVNIGSSQVTYLTHNTLNYLITTNPSFCKETEVWLKNLMNKSILLTGASEKQRNQFFRRAEDNINVLKSKIEVMKYA